MTHTQSIIPTSFDATLGNYLFGIPELIMSRTVITKYFDNIGVYDHDLVGIPKLTGLLEKPGISPLVQTQFPEFVRQDHPRFIAFMNAYYKWMETKTGVLYDSQRMISYQDIDTSTDLYTEQFFREFLVDIPRNILVDKKILLKNIRQFYRAKGTEKSYKLFFRMLYNLNVDFYYPRTDLLKTSDGKWIKNKTIKVYQNATDVGDASQFRGRKILGKTFNASAYVESVFAIRYGSLEGYELVLNHSSIVGKFDLFDTVYSEYTDEFGNLQKITATVSPVPIATEIQTPGSGYQVGDTFQLMNDIIVKVLSVGTLGEIQRLQIKSYGFGFLSNADIGRATNIRLELPQGRTGQDAYIGFSFGSMTDYPGFYANDDGQLSTTKYLHDGVFYQQFSYVLYSNLSFSDYSTDLKRLIHPAGLKAYGGFRSQDLLRTKIREAKKHTHVRREHQKKVRTTSSLSPVMHIRHDIIQSPETHALGATHRSISQNAFKYKPYSRYDANSEFDGSLNWYYFGDPKDLSRQISITPISVFDYYGYTPRSIAENPYKKTNIQPDSVIISKSLLKPVEFILLYGASVEYVDVGDYVWGGSWEIKNNTKTPIMLYGVWDGTQWPLWNLIPNSALFLSTVLGSADFSGQVRTFKWIAYPPNGPPEESITIQRIVR